MVGATGSSANLSSDVLSRVRYEKLQIISRKRLNSIIERYSFSKYTSIPPPPLRERRRFLKSKMREGHFTNKIIDMEMEFIGQETEKYSFKDLERLW